MTPRTDSLLGSFASLTAAEQTQLLDDVARETRLPVAVVKARLIASWRVIARPKQLPPPGDWTYWWLLSGRGFGKTRSAAEWIAEEATREPMRVGLVAPTFADGRDVMVEGVTGLLAALKPHQLRDGSRQRAWNRSIGELILANGSVLKVFSSEEPDRIRSWQFQRFWGEEVSAWKDANRKSTPENPTTWTNLTIAARLETESGDHGRGVLTSTPRPNRLTHELDAIEPPAMMKVRGSSFENRANLPESYWEQVIVPLLGTRVGRQEIEAEILTDVEGALWNLAQLEELRVREAPELERIVVAVDPNVSNEEAANSAGIIVVGKGAADGWGYVLADRTITSGGPRAWGRAAIAAYEEFEADRIVAEKNQGGEMVRVVLQTVDPNAPITLVHASQGKRARAEPVASLYEGDPEKGNPPKVRHVGRFPELEEEMTTWTPGAESPDRMDALVWGLWALLMNRQKRTTIHVPRGRIQGADSGRGPTGY